MRPLVKNAAAIGTALLSGATPVANWTGRLSLAGDWYTYAVPPWRDWVRPMLTLENLARVGLAAGIASPAWVNLEGRIRAEWRRALGLAPPAPEPPPALLRPEAESARVAPASGRTGPSSTS